MILSKAYLFITSLGAVLVEANLFDVSDFSPKAPSPTKRLSQRPTCNPGQPEPPKPPKTPYLMEAEKVAAEIIKQINNDDNDPNNRGVLQHGLYPTDLTPDSATMVAMYKASGKIDWNHGNYQLSTDSQGCPKGNESMQTLQLILGRLT